MKGVFVVIEFMDIEVFLGWEFVCFEEVVVFMCYGILIKCDYDEKYVLVL